MAGRAFDGGFGPGFGSPVSFGTLLLKVGTDAPDPTGYQDGDVVMAFNRRMCRQRHAHAICHPKHAPRNSSGLIPLTDKSRDWFEHTHAYRFERASVSAVLRYTLGTADVDLITNVANAAGERMDVVTHIARRRANPACAMFGVDGAEVWYGVGLDGSPYISDAQLDAVWAAIENKSPLRELDHADWPFGWQELQTMLALRVDDFDDTEANALVAPVQDLTDPDRPILLRRRARRVQWRGLAGMSAARIAQIEDRTQTVNLLAERKHPRALAVEVKP